MFLYSKWLALPINTRHKIAQELGIIKKNPTHVQDNVIVSDGYAVKDVEEALTVSGLQSYLGVGVQVTDEDELWDMLINPPQVKQTGELDKDFGIQTLKVEAVKTTPKKNVKKTTKNK